MKDKLLATKQASEFLGVSVSTLYRMEKNGVLNPSKTPGGHRRFNTLELEKYMSESKKIESQQNPSTKKEAKEKSTDKPKEKKKGKYHTGNKMNNLTGTEWLPETKSYSYQTGLGAKHAHAQIERLHPAPYSFQDVSKLITFFTKKDMVVLDPFGGVGSTAKAAVLEDRTCISIELSEKWHDLSIERLETEVGEGESDKCTFINGDSKKELKKLENDSVDFIVTSPPYWSILNKKADHKVKKERLEFDLDTNYSDNDEQDIGNVEDYDEFLDILVNDFLVPAAYTLKPKKYMAVVVSDFRNKSEYISFHSDVIQKLNKFPLNNKYQLKLQGCKVLLQNHKSLLPYGYPYAYVENIHHQYILVFRKDK